jgi:hypothetical protein
MRKVTSEEITELKENEVFVFGSNEAGRHGAGAAKLAKDKFGAIEGKGFGPQGQSWGIPTKNWDVSCRLPLPVIECYAVRFCEYAAMNPKQEFLVTQIGCGLAGYKPEDIAPFFAMAEKFGNIHLPQCFWDVIDKVYREELIKKMIFEDDGATNEL